MKKIAVITGATSGMGRECALQIDTMFQALDEIWIFGRREDRLTELDKDLNTRTQIFNLDLMEKTSIEKYQNRLKSEEAEIVFLVNAAGVGKLGPLETIRMEDVAGMVELNCRVLTEMTRASLPYLAKKARILNFASSAAFLPQPQFAVYAATKSYVLSFSRALNHELKKKMCSVTAVCPGPVKTEFFDIAQTSGHMVPIYKKLVMADPKKVVKLALMDAVLKKDVSIYGISMRIFCVLSKIMPAQLLFAMADFFSESNNR